MEFSILNFVILAIFAWTTVDTLFRGRIFWFLVSASITVFVFSQLFPALSVLPLIGLA